MNTINEAIEDIRNGKMVIVIDDEKRENEGDLVMAAQAVTPNAINFMIKEGKGLVCMPMTATELDRLQLHPMVTNNSDPYHTAFTISVDHISSTTGISAKERAETIKQLANGKNTQADFVCPGHIFPLRAKEGGIIERPGHTEAAVELANLAGFTPAGVICEIINDDGSMARLPDLEIFAAKWNLKIISIEALIKFKNKVTREVKVKLPTKFGEFDLYAFSDVNGQEPHLAIVKGDIGNSSKPVLTRIHSECLTGDLLGSMKCDCGMQLSTALKNIQKEGKGICLYLRQEGRGIGLLNKLKAYKLQENGADTVDANTLLGFEPELRDYKVAADILKDLQVNTVNLMTNNPLKIKGLEENGIIVEKRFAIKIEPNELNIDYLETKRKRMGHLL